MDFHDRIASGLHGFWKHMLLIYFRLFLSSSLQQNWPLQIGDVEVKDKLDVAAALGYLSLANFSEGIV